MDRCGLYGFKNKSTHTQFGLLLLAGISMQRGVSGLKGGDLGLIDPRKALLHGFFLLLLHFWLLCCFPRIKVTSLLVSSETSIAVGSVPRHGVLHSAPGEVSPLSTALSSVLRPAFPSPPTRLHPQAQPLHH